MMYNIFIFIKSKKRHLSLAQDGVGFTLIEVLIALSVFSIGIVGSFVLAITNLRQVEANQDRVTIANLAREGIEMIKNKRDSNWLKIQANIDCDAGTGGLQLCEWYDGLDSGYYIVDIIPNQTPACSCNDVNAAACSTTATDCGVNPEGNSWQTDWDGDKLLSTNVDGWYVHDSNETATNIYRLISIKDICMDIVGVETVKSMFATCVAGETKVGLEVTAHMRWQKFDKFEKVDIVDRIYNWRR